VTPHERDFQGVKLLLDQLLPDGELDASDLADLIVGLADVDVGNFIKVREGKASRLSTAT
jgi:hypothetical protein